MLQPSLTIIMNSEYWYTGFTDEKNNLFPVEKNSENQNIECSSIYFCP